MSPQPARSRGPRRLLLIGLVLTALFGLVHWLGWRQDTAILSGATPPAGGILFRGGSYLLLYAGVVILAPIITIAALVLALLNRLK